MTKYSTEIKAAAKKILEMDKEKIAVYHIETTGLNSVDNEILKVTILDGKGKELFNKLMKPEKTKLWKSAQAVNHINYDMVADKKPFKEYVSELKSIFDNADMIVGYNNFYFDNHFLLIQSYFDKDRIELEKKKNFDIMLEQNEIDYINGTEEFCTYKTMCGCCRSYDVDFDPDNKVESIRQCLFNMINKIIAAEPESDETNE